MQLSWEITSHIVHKERKQLLKESHEQSAPGYASSHYIITYINTTTYLILHNNKPEHLCTDSDTNKQAWVTHKSTPTHMNGYLRMKPPLMAICSRSSTTRAPGWLFTTPSWFPPQAWPPPLILPHIQFSQSQCSFSFCMYMFMCVHVYACLLMTEWLCMCVFVGTSEAASECECK